MNAWVVFAIIMLVLILLALYMVSQTNKGFLVELQKGLNLRDFSVSCGLGRTKLKATWSELPLTIDALSRTLSRPADIYYRIEQRYNFAAVITAGVGLNEKKPSAKEQADDEAVARPWRAKLTEEEQKIIDERRGGAAEVVNDKLNITSNRPNEVSKFLQSKEKVQALEDLLKSGITSVQFSATEIVVHKRAFTNDDMLPKQVEKYLKNMKSLLN